MEKIKFEKRYKCKDCGKFLFERRITDGYIVCNPKCKPSTNGIIYKIECSCKKIDKFEI